LQAVECMLLVIKHGLAVPKPLPYLPLPVRSLSSITRLLVKCETLLWLSLLLCSDLWFETFRYTICKMSLSKRLK
jgi:hypothetical protein